MDTIRKSSRRRMLGAFAAMFLAAGGVAVATPAQAAPAGCSLGTTCLYSGYSYTNDAAQNPSTLWFSYCIDDLGVYTYNNVASSVYNNGRTDDMRLYDLRFKGSNVYKTIFRDTGSTNLGSTGWNDRTSSAYFIGALGYSGSSTCS